MKLLKIESIFNLLGYNVDKAYNDLINIQMIPLDEFRKWKEKKKMGNS